MNATAELLQPSLEASELRVLEFEVLGRPQPAGSKRAFKHPHTGRIILTDMNRKARPWMQEVAAVARASMGGCQMLRGPLFMEVTFFMARPKSHFGTGRRAMFLKDSAPEFPVTRPDTTKLLRGLEDALSGVVYADDSQIVTQVVRKRYGDPERVEVRLDRLDG
jgi:Holliday junction resolvase RusA-like endonuclease